GKKQEDAVKELEKLKLTVQLTTQQTGKPAGTVTEQDPKAGAKLPENKTVNLIVEAGASAGNNSNPDSGQGTTAGVMVPPLEGKPLAEAIVQLANAGLRAQIRRIESVQQGELVLELNPRSGTVVAANTEVIVSVPDSVVTVPGVT